MKSFLIQLIAFLFVVLTPAISWFAGPLYVMLNLILAFASIVALLVTSRQVDGQIAFERTSFAGRLFQIWYWTNVVIAMPCIVYASVLLIFGTQQGNHIVTRRETRELNNLSGRMDVLYGRSKNDSNPRAVNPNHEVNHNRIAISTALRLRWLAQANRCQYPTTLANQPREGKARWMRSILRLRSQGTQYSLIPILA